MKIRVGDIGIDLQMVGLMEKLTSTTLSCCINNCEKVITFPTEDELDNVFDYWTSNFQQENPPPSEDDFEVPPVEVIT
jgi:hypothetical protein